MAWAFGAAGTAATSSAATSGDGGLTVSLPSGVTSGQLLLLAAMRRPDTGQTWASGPSGYTELGSDAQNQLKLWGKIAGGSESNPNIIATEGNVAMAQMARFTGAPASIGSIVHAIANGGSDYNLVEDIDTPALVISAAGTLVIYLGAASWSNWVAGTNPNGSTTIGHTNYTGTYANGWLAWSYEIQTTAANVAASKFDSTSSSTHRTDSMVISLIPGASASVVPLLQAYRSMLVR